MYTCGSEESTSRQDCGQRRDEGGERLEYVKGMHTVRKRWAGAGWFEARCCKTLSCRATAEECADRRINFIYHLRTLGEM